MPTEVSASSAMWRARPAASTSFNSSFVCLLASQRFLKDRMIRILLGTQIDGERLAFLVGRRRHLDDTRRSG